MQGVCGCVCVQVWCAATAAKSEWEKAYADAYRRLNLFCIRMSFPLRMGPILFSFATYITFPHEHYNSINHYHRYFVTCHCISAIAHSIAGQSKCMWENRMMIIFCVHLSYSTGELTY